MNFNDMSVDIGNKIENKITLNGVERVITGYRVNDITLTYPYNTMNSFSILARSGSSTVWCHYTSSDRDEVHAMLTTARTAMLALEHGAVVWMNIDGADSSLSRLSIRPII